MLLNNKYKILNIESWAVEDVCEWLVGIGDKAELYRKNFEKHQINGKKLVILEKSDLFELGIEILDHRIAIFNIIRNLVQLRHDLSNETLNSLIYNVRNRVIYIIRYVEKLGSCNCRDFSCISCHNLKHDVFRLTSALTTSYRKLLSWLARLPFTRVEKVDKFRDEINTEMKCLFKLFRKCSRSEDFLANLTRSLFKMLDRCANVLDICYIQFKEYDREEPKSLTKLIDEENKIANDELSKNSVILSSCYLEKVLIKKKTEEQILGLSLVNLIDGIYTVGDIAKESACDECSRLNIGDDIISIDNQVVIGWNPINIDRLLESKFEINLSFSLLLRKMPRDNIQTLKQQRAMDKISTLPMRERKRSYKDRKHSFADVFHSDQEILDEVTSEDDDEMPIYGISRQTASHGDGGRRIQSMQNLHIQKSRSNSIDILDTDEKLKQRSAKQRKKSEDTDSGKTDFTSKSEILRSLFSNKKFHTADFFHRNKKQPQTITTPYDYTTDVQQDPNSTPNLLNIRRLDSKSNSLNKENQYINNNSVNSNGSNKGSNVTNIVLSKPPLDSKKLYKPQLKQKPILQAWLYKRKPLDKMKHHHTIIRNINSKWQRYWCEAMKDHIIFYKHPDDRTPKDGLILKDFDIQRSDNRPFGFILTVSDKSKQTTQAHEFYVESAEEYRQWHQCLYEIRIKGSGINDFDSIAQFKQVFNEDFSKINTSQLNSILQSNNSSRESSPGASSSKINSGASSPVLNYLNSNSNKNGSESEIDLDMPKQQSSPSLPQQKYDSTSNLPNLQYRNRLKEKLVRNDSSFYGLSSNINEDVVSNQLQNAKKIRELNKKQQSLESYVDQSNDDEERSNSLPGSLPNSIGSYFNDSFRKLSATQSKSIINSQCGRKNGKKSGTTTPSVKDEHQTACSHPPYSRPLPLLASILSKRQALAEQALLPATPTTPTPQPTSPIYRTEITILPSNRITFTKHNQKS